MSTVTRPPFSDFHTITAKRCSKQSQTICGHVVLYGQRVGYRPTGRKRLYCAECWRELEAKEKAEREPWWAKT